MGKWCKTPPSNPFYCFPVYIVQQIFYAAAIYINRPPLLPNTEYNPTQTLCNHLCQASCRCSLALIILAHSSQGTCVWLNLKYWYISKNPQAQTCVNDLWPPTVISGYFFKIAFSLKQIENFVWDIFVSPISAGKLYNQASKVTT